MAARLGAKKLPRYSLEFKQQAVRLTRIPGIEVQVVAEALDIHPVMLSRWRQEAREGRLRGTSGRRETPPKVPLRELKRLQALEREHRLLQEEHELLKKAIRFCSEQRRTSSRSSRGSAGRSS
jgi:transposase